jgi:hypothetical protein
MLNKKLVLAAAVALSAALPASAATKHHASPIFITPLPAALGRIAQPGPMSENQPTRLDRRLKELIGQHTERLLLLVP